VSLAKLKDLPHSVALTPSFTVAVRWSLMTTVRLVLSSGFNEHYLEFKRLIDSSLNQIGSTVEVTEGFYKDVPMPSAFQMRELMSPVNQYGEVGLLILMGNLIHKQPRRNGKLISIMSN